MKFFDAGKTAELLTYPALVETLKHVLREYDQGRIMCPERLNISCDGGRGVLLSMPCHSHDLLVHKLLAIYAGNPSSNLPAIHGTVTCFDVHTGVPLFYLDGPTVTARRTAAISMIGIQHLTPAVPRNLLLIGTGGQAFAHTQAALQLFPDLLIHVQARTERSASEFCARVAAPDRAIPAKQGAAERCEVVVAATSSKTPVYDEPAQTGRLVIGVGAYRLDMVEIGSRLIRGSQVYVDDIVGAPGEAGDVVEAGTDWKSVRTLASSLDDAPDFSRPIFLKSVGCGAWDLAACRTARASLFRGSL